MMRNQERTRVIHIVGAGRSGSTVLDVTLGSHPDVTSVGELVNLVPSVWPANGFCACGTRVRACGFWSEAYRRWSNGRDVDPTRYGRLQAGHERWTLFPSLLARPVCADGLLRAYGSLTDGLYKAVAGVSGCRVVVDSSKLPPRALAIGLSSRLDVRLIHLVRDPRGVAWSLLKSYGRNERGGVQKAIPSRPPWRSAVHWLLSNIGSDLVLSRLASTRKVMRIRYEDFVRAPRSTLNRIGDFVGVDYGAVGAMVERQGEVRPSHNVAGNRLRMSDRVRIEGDFEWREKLSDSGKRQIEMISKPLLRRYGYVRG